MRIQSEDVPQADNIYDVIKAVEAVSQGYASYQEIASYIGKVGRQGRYYRRAAENLGFIKNYHNKSVLTKLGRAFVKANKTDRDNILFHAVLNSRIFQRLVPFFEMHRKGVSRSQIISFMSEVTEPTGTTMMGRRSNTVINWLQSVGIITPIQDKYMLTDLIRRNIDSLEFSDEDEPILPKNFNLEEYKIVYMFSV